MPRTRVIALAAGALAITLLAEPAATAGVTTRPDPIPHPTGADAIIIEIDHETNGWGAEYSDGFDVRVYGDGRVVVTPPATGDGPPPEPEVLQVGERGLQRLLRAAKRAGLLAATDYGEAGVTDQGTSSIHLYVDGVHRYHSVYALLLEDGDRGLHREQRKAREKLRDFVHDAAERSFYETGARAHS